MELTIVDPETDICHQAFGIADERRQELMKQLDEIMARYWKAGPFRVSDVLVQIAGICRTPEEFGIACWTNGEWMERNRYITKLT